MVLFGLLAMGLLPLAFMIGDGAETVAPAGDDAGDADQGSAAADASAMPDPDPQSQGGQAAVPGPTDGNDTLTAGDDPIEGGAGDDALSGGSGADTLLGDRIDTPPQGPEPGQDTLTGNEGNDILAGGGNSDLLFGGAGDDRLIHLGYATGHSGSDLFEDRLDRAVDLIYGGDGNDLIEIDSADFAYGGAGSDLFRLYHAPGSAATIGDFDPAEDHLVVLMPPGPALQSVQVIAVEGGSLITVDGSPVAFLQGADGVQAQLSDEDQYLDEAGLPAPVVVVRFGNVLS